MANVGGTAGRQKKQHEQENEGENACEQGRSEQPQPEGWGNKQLILWGLTAPRPTKIRWR